MAEPKKDDKKDGKKEEKSIYAVLVTIGLIALAAWAFFIFIPIPAVGILNAIGQMINDVGDALGNMGESARNAARGIRNLFSGFGKVVKEIISGLFLPILIGIMIYSFLPKKGGYAKADDKATKPAEPAKH